MCLNAWVQSGKKTFHWSSSIKAREPTNFENWYLKAKNQVFILPFLLYTIARVIKKAKGKFLFIEVFWLLFFFKRITDYYYFVFPNKLMDWGSYYISNNITKEQIIRFIYLMTAQNITFGVVLIKEKRWKK